MFMHYYGFNDGSFWPIVMMVVAGLFWILILTLIIVLIYKLISHRPSAHPDRETPLEILEKEYARGNISEEEFLNRKKNLQ